MSDPERQESPLPDAGGPTTPETAQRPGHQVWCTTEPPAGADRCPTCGVFLRDNAAALTTGVYSDRLWQGTDDQRAEAERELLAEAGYPDPASAPLALRVAVASVASAMALRERAWQSAVQARADKLRRRAIAAWEQAADRCDRAIDRYSQRVRELRAQQPGSPAQRLDSYDALSDAELDQRLVEQERRLGIPREWDPALELEGWRRCGLDGRPPRFARLERVPDLVAESPQLQEAVLSRLDVTLDARAREAAARLYPDLLVREPDAITAALMGDADLRRAVVAALVRQQVADPALGELVDEDDDVIIFDDEEEEQR